jgi:hypothetical protein
MPMKKILTITGILIWTSGQTCDCDYIGNFLTISKWAEVIFIVKVTGHGDYISLTGAAPNTVSVPLTATFEVIKTLKGNTDKKEIRVFGDNGVLCRPYIDTFQKDKYYVVGLYRCDGKERNETVDDFQITGCGEFWIQYNPESSTVTGRIKNKKRKRTTMTLETFEKLLKAS